MIGNWGQWGSLKSVQNLLFIYQVIMITSPASYIDSIGIYIKQCLSPVSFYNISDIRYIINTVTFPTIYPGSFVMLILEIRELSHGSLIMCHQNLYGPIAINFPLLRLHPQ